MVYSPAGRLLTLLDVLQSRPSVSATDLADRLQVETRSVRRYILLLQDMGIPVESRRGRYGGYRLRRGYKLPPLMLTPDEIEAAVLGAQWVAGRGDPALARFSFGAMKQVSPALATISLPPVITVSSPSST